MRAGLAVASCLLFALASPSCKKAQAGREVRAPWPSGLTLGMSVEVGLTTPDRAGPILGELVKVEHDWLSVRVHGGQVYRVSRDKIVTISVWPEER